MAQNIGSTEVNKSKSVFNSEYTPNLGGIASLSQLSICFFTALTTSVFCLFTCFLACVSHYIVSSRKARNLLVWFSALVLIADTMPGTQWILHKHLLNKWMKTIVLDGYVCMYNIICMYTHIHTTVHICIHKWTFVGAFELMFFM